MTALRKLVYLLLILSCFAACSFKTPQPIDRKGFETASVEEKAELLEQLKAYASQVESVQTNVQIKVKRGWQTMSKDKRITFIRPDKIRLETLGSESAVIPDTIIIHHQAVHAVDYGSRRIYRGTSKQKNIRRLLSIPLPLDEIMTWMAGHYEPPRTQKPAAFLIKKEKDADSNNYRYDASDYQADLNQDKDRALLRFTLNDGRSVQLIVQTDKLFSDEEAGPPPDQAGVLNVQPLAPEATIPLIALEKMEVRSENGRRVFYSEFDYAEHKTANSTDVLVPKEIRFWCPEDEFSGKLTFKSWAVNPNLGAQLNRLFTGETPPSLHIWNLDNDRGESFEPLI